jgi:hypothetical protein
MEALPWRLPCPHGLAFPSCSGSWSGASGNFQVLSSAIRY